MHNPRIYGLLKQAFIKEDPHCPEKAKAKRFASKANEPPVWLNGSGKKGNQRQKESRGLLFFGGKCINVRLKKPSHSLFKRIVDPKLSAQAINPAFVGKHHQT